MSSYDMMVRSEYGKESVSDLEPQVACPHNVDNVKAVNEVDQEIDQRKKTVLPQYRYDARFLAP